MVGRHKSDRKLRQGEERAFRKILAWMIIFGVVVVLGAGFWWLGQRKAEIATLDPETFCPIAGPTSVLAVLIDRTDPLTEIQGEALKRLILTWAHEVPKHGAFRVYEVGVGSELLVPVVSVCNPGDGSDMSGIDSNPAFWRKRYQEKFMSPISTMLAAMRRDVEAPKSPIMEGVQAISVRDFGPDARSGPKSLIIVSDLLQNTTDISLYRGVPDPENFSRSPGGAALHADLSGVDISIYLLNRRSAADKQTDALGQFWIKWLTLQGGDFGEFRRIPG